jgi:hypothetical protein
VLNTAVNDIIGMITKAQTYVAKAIKDGKGDSAVARDLLDSLALVPQLDKEQIEKLHDRHSGNMLTAVYLSKLTRLQLDLASKIARMT